MRGNSRSKGLRGKRVKENYIVLNGNRIELTEEQIAKIKEGFCVPKKTLAEVAAGDVCKLGHLELIVLEQTGELTAVLLKDFWKTAKFDNDKNSYFHSSIRKDLNTNFYKELADVVGEDNIYPHEIDITADDGRTEYGACRDNIGLMTTAEYRKYVYLLDNHRPDSWWWLATPYSTEANGYSYTVRVVDNDGSLNINCCRLDGGVRPFCILKSNIFVSE